MGNTPYSSVLENLTRRLDAQECNAPWILSASQQQQQGCDKSSKCDYLWTFLRLTHCQWRCWYHTVSDAGGWLASGVDAYRVTMEWDYKYIIRIGGCLLDQAVLASAEMVIPSRASELWGKRKLLDELIITTIWNCHGCDREIIIPILNTCRGIKIASRGWIWI